MKPVIISNAILILSDKKNHKELIQSKIILIYVFHVLLIMKDNETKTKNTAWSPVSWIHL